MASDGTRLYLAVAQSVEAFDGHGTLVWKHAFPGATGLAVASGTVVSRGPTSTIGIDAASGALRWSVAHVAGGSAFAVGDGFVGTGSGNVLQILDVKSGRLRARAAGDCTSLSEAGSSFACTLQHVDDTSLTVFDAATGHAMVTLPEGLSNITTIGSTFYAYANGVIEIHPLHRTYDVLTFPGSDDSDRGAAFDGKYVVYHDGSVARRYRLDASPSTQRPVPFSVGDPAGVWVGAGVVASFAALGKPLTIVTFDAAGKPSAVVYSGVLSTRAPVVLIRQGLAFADTPGGDITVVDLAHRRVLGTAALSCDGLEDAAVAGGIAAVGCQKAASYRVDGIDLGR
jgi:hypothetical protein